MSRRGRLREAASLAGGSVRCAVPSGNAYTPPTVLRADCPSNQLYVSALVYGLTQPSRMGGKYWSMQ